MRVIDQSFPASVGGAAVPDTQKPLRVAVAGCGVVGEGVVLDLLEQSGKYEVVSVLVKNLQKRRAREIDQHLFTNGIEEFLDAKPDIVIDALSSGSEGVKLAAKALARGASVVSANKQAVAGNLAHLHRLAEENRAAFYYSPSVGGGTPIIETVRAATEKSEIKTIEAILNGTVNYILTALGDGASFDAAVKAAQEAGFAEADPSADLQGLDAAAKARILGFEAFGVEIPDADIPVEALDAARVKKILEDPGAWRQIARIGNDGGLKAQVRFEKVDGDKLFAGAVWEGNALRVTCSNGEIFQTRGRGAGRAPTVASVLADLQTIRLSRER